MPVTAINIPEGSVDFLPDSPWIPLLDVRGTARVRGFEIQAYAFGPLNEKKLILRSEPALSQRALVRLLAGGVGGGDREPGPGFGQGASDHALFLPLRFSNRIDWTGAEAGSESLNASAGVPKTLWETASTPRILQLGEPLDTSAGLEDNKIFNSAATYIWRFQ